MTEAWPDGLGPVAVDLRLWRHSGIGRWLRHLVPALAEQGLPLTLWGQPQHLNELAEAFPGQTLRPCPHAPLRPWDVAFWPGALRASGASVLFWPHYDAPPTGGLPLVGTVHDLTPLDWPGVLRWPGAAHYMRWRTAWTLSRAARVLVHAPHVGEALGQRFALAPERRLVAPPAVSEAWATTPAAAFEPLARRLGLGPGPMVLALGLWKRHKNWPTLVQGMVAAQVPALQLVLVGQEDPREQGLLDQLAWAEGQGLKVVRAGLLPDAELLALLDRALALGFPSLAEGFGLPPLEALARGCPALVAEGPWLDASVGQAAWRLPPQAPQAWAEAIAHLVWEKEQRPEARANRVARGRAQAATLSWARSAQALAEALREAALSGRGCAKGRPG